MARTAAKARKHKLKVFRTPIGFHDAYVAAPSRKAALEAWGASTDLFTAKIAEEVTDSRWMKQALERPGEIVRVPRGDAEQLASSSRPGVKAKPIKGRRPSRAALERAEKTVAGLERRQASENTAMSREEKALAKRKRALEKRHSKAMHKTQAARDEAEERYRQATREWRG